MHGQKKATQKIVQIVVGIALYALSALPVFALTVPAGSLAPDVSNINAYGGNMSGYVTFNSSITNVSDLAAKGINWVLGFLGIIAVILILISGWQWMTAESEDKVKEARKRLVNSVIGLAIVALAWIIGFVIVNTLTTVIK